MNKNITPFGVDKPSSNWNDYNNYLSEDEKELSSLRAKQKDPSYWLSQEEFDRINFLTKKINENN